jgi:hypothetical protein
MRQSVSPRWTTYWPVQGAGVGGGLPLPGPGITSRWPTWMRLTLASRLAAAMACTLTPKRTAMRLSVSPRWTM